MDLGVMLLRDGENLFNPLLVNAQFRRHFGRLIANHVQQAVEPGPVLEDEIHALSFEKFQHLVTRKTAIEPHQQPCLRERRPQPLDHPRQNACRAQLRRRVARAQHVGEQILFGFVVKLHENIVKNHRQRALIVFSSLENADEAMVYLEKLKKAAPTQVSWLQASKYSFYPINNDNLQLLKSNKELDNYKKLLNNQYPGKF